MGEARRKPNSQALTSPAVGACFGGGDVDADVDSGGGGTTFAWTGTVQEAGGGAPDGCTQKFGTVDSSAWWVRLDVEGEDAWVAVAAPGSAAPAVGARITVSGTHRVQAFSPDEGAVEVRVDVALLAWAATAGSVGALTPPSEVTLAQGDSSCTVLASCGVWSAYKLEATAGGESVSLGEGERGSAGGLTVTNAALRLSTGSTSCMDWYVAEATIGIAG